MSTTAAISMVLIVGVLAFLFGRMSVEMSGPHNYNDCVLDAMKGGGRGMEATMLIHHACEQKFRDR